MSTLTAQQIFNERIRHQMIEAQRLMEKVKEYHMNIASGRWIHLDIGEKAVQYMIKSFKPRLAVTGQEARIVVDFTLTDDHSSEVRENVTLELNSFEVL